jgi:hypothetical protein
VPDGDEIHGPIGPPQPDPPEPAAEPLLLVIPDVEVRAGIVPVHAKPDPPSLDGVSVKHRGRDEFGNEVEILFPRNLTWIGVRRIGAGELLVVKVAELGGTMLGAAVLPAPESGELTADPGASG